MVPTPKPSGIDTDRKRISRTSQAYETIQRAIAELTYPPGATFTEGELATSLGLTKTPVREALLMLSSQELVTARPGAGYVVMPMTLKDIRSLCRHWRRLEGDAAAEVAAAGLSSTTVMYLTELAQGTGDAADLSTLDRDLTLHWWIVEASTDEYLCRDFNRLMVEIERLYRLTLGPDSPVITASHDDILRAVVSGDADTAKAAIIANVNRLEREIIEVLLSGDVLMSTNLGPHSAGN